MRADTARALALKAALELRTGIDTPESVIDRARKFEVFIAAEGPPPPAEAKQETASARAPRGK